MKQDHCKNCKYYTPITKYQTFNDWLRNDWEDDGILHSNLLALMILFMIPVVNLLVLPIILAQYFTERKEL